jgi:hypothetical protein
MDEQLIIYENILTERAEKELKIFMKKYKTFVRNRSAKIIQRWWRQICLEKMKKNKKKKKKKKGKVSKFKLL